MRMCEIGSSDDTEQNIVQFFLNSYTLEVTIKRGVYHDKAQLLLLC